MAVLRPFTQIYHNLVFRPLFKPVAIICAVLAVGDIIAVNVSALTSRIYAYKCVCVCMRIRTQRVLKG